MHRTFSSDTILREISIKSRCQRSLFQRNGRPRNPPQSALGLEAAPTHTTFCQHNMELSALGNKVFSLTFGCSADFQLTVLPLELVALSTCSQPFSPSPCSMAWDCLGLASRGHQLETTRARRREWSGHIFPQLPQGQHRQL